MGFETKKDQSSISAFPYTLLGYVFMLLAILLILFQTGTTDLQILLTTEFSERRKTFYGLLFFRLFRRQSAYGTSSIWLPRSSCRGTYGRIRHLGGILLKLGTYGFLRFSIPMFLEATLCFTPFIYTLSAIAIIYTSLTTLRQIDLRRSLLTPQ
ncbi:putative NADH:ubiquinone reductase (H(+)-translocating) [Helianthus annuus]|nr:putative NADH:ubiquinone reductase (H(+)-translocating) [Helianthus annuus]